MIQWSRWHVLGIVVALGVGAALAVLVVKASAGMAENCPIPRKMVITTCTAEQGVAAHAADVCLQHPANDLSVRVQ